MRITEFEDKALLRAIENEKINHDQLDEIMPALGMAAGTIGRIGAKMGAQAAKMGAQAGTQLAKTGAKVAQNVGAKAVAGAKGMGKKMAMKVGQQAMNMMQKQLLKKGAKIPMPVAQGNKTQDFEIDAVQGDEVTIKNPKPKPGEPTKTVHNKKDLEPIIKSLANQ